MLFRIPTSQSQTGLGSLILQISCQDLSCLFIGNVVGLVIIVEKVTIVRVTILIIGRDIIIVRVVSLEMIFLGLFKQSR